MSSEPHRTTATAHTSTRLSVGSGLPYDELVQRYESTVPPLPAVDLARVLESDGIEAARDLLAASSPVRLFRFCTLDASPYMGAAGLAPRCRIYLMGNPATAEKMYGFDPTVMLYAPLRTLIHEDGAGDGVLVLDRPSDLFGSFDSAEVGRVGRYLDSAVAALLDAMDVPVPSELNRACGTSAPQGSTDRA